MSGNIWWTAKDTHRYTTDTDTPTSLRFPRFPQIFPRLVPGSADMFAVSPDGPDKKTNNKKLKNTTYENKLIEHNPPFPVQCYTKYSRNCNHYRLAIEGNFERYTKNEKQTIFNIKKTKSIEMFTLE